VTPEPIRWDAPGPYRVAFSTRVGGVSAGPYDSLNLGTLTDDDPAAVVENRSRLCTSVGADPATATMARQQHGGRVCRARPTGVVAPGAAAADAYDACDGLFTTDPGQGLLLVTADCVPIALVRATAAPGTGGEPGNGLAASAAAAPAPAPGLALLHAGWRGLLAGIVDQGIRALGGGPHPGAAPLAAAIGPSIGPCCYRVGDDVAAPFREAFGKDIVSGGHLDLPTAVERALRMAGVNRIRRFDRCTACNGDLFFSHRRDAGVTGRQGVIGVIA
jgi:copper oxidase (laccase) domain-containing protein